MVERQSRESILIADCGSTNTRAVLLDIVNGQYRMIAYGQAPSTAEPHWSDVRVGLLRAVAEIESITGRQLVGEGNRLVIPSEGLGTGVDVFLATTSAAQPLAVVVTGLMEDVSLASARQVALSTYATIQDALSLADRRPEEELVRHLVALEPDVFLVTGGTDGGASEAVIRMVETISMVIPLITTKLHAPMVVYAGNAALRSRIGEVLSGVQWRTADNVRPKIGVECLGPAQAELGAILEETRLLDLPGARELRSLTEGGLVPTAKAFGLTVQYLGEIHKTNVVAADVGSASVMIGAVLDGAAQLVVRSDLGIGHDGYLYAHEAPDGIAAQEYLGIQREYYQPVPRGFEAELAQRLEIIRRRLHGET